MQFLSYREHKRTEVRNSFVLTHMTAALNTICTEGRAVGFFFSREMASEGIPPLNAGLGFWVFFLLSLSMMRIARSGS